MTLKRADGPPVFLGETRNTYEGALHEALNDLIEDMKQGKVGGEQILIDQDDGTTFRITLCDWKGREPCPACNGTGASRFTNTQN